MNSLPSPLLPTAPIDPQRPVLFCLPHAGGGTSYFYRWRRYMPPWLQLAPLRLPGREDRLTEPAVESVPQLVEDVAQAIAQLQPTAFALVGYSMGSYVAFEAARLLEAERQLTPAALVVAAATAPQLVTRSRLLHTLPDNQLAVELQAKYDGIPDALLADRDLLQLVLPTLRSDMKLIETYEYQAGRQVSCDLLALGGLDDPGVGYKRLAGWVEQTTGSFTLQQFPGRHFFLYPEARRQAAETMMPASLGVLLNYLSEAFEPFGDFGLDD